MKIRMIKKISTLKICYEIYELSSRKLKEKKLIKIFPHFHRFFFIHTHHSCTFKPCMSNKSIIKTEIRNPVAMWVTQQYIFQASGSSHFRAVEVHDGDLEWRRKVHMIRIIGKFNYLCNLQCKYHAEMNPFLFIIFSLSSSPYRNSYCDISEKTLQENFKKVHWKVGKRILEMFIIKSLNEQNDEILNGLSQALSFFFFVWNFVPILSNPWKRRKWKRGNQILSGKIKTINV